LSRYCVSSHSAHAILPLGILALLNTRHMSDCSNCTRPPYHALVADVLKTCQTFDTASNNEIRLVPQSCMLL
jgi:hypothetical protein